VQDAAMTTVTKATTVSKASIGLRSERGPILLSLMLATGLVAIDSTIIATAVPSIVSSVGGFAQFPWLFSIYLLAQAITVPIYGKLADLFGRKPVMVWGICVFLLGSVMCGFAPTMTVLIAFRAVQGLGAGAISPMSVTIIGDLYSVRERAKVQGYIATVWGLASVVGPALGGVLSEYVSWRWIFFVNIPLCILAGAVLLRSFTEQIERTKPKIDYLGAALLTTASGSLILAALEGGQAWGWFSAPGIVVVLFGISSLAAFIAVEKRVPEPVLPLWVYNRRVLLTSSLTAACMGAILLGMSAYIPTYVQDVLGFGPVVAGFALSALVIGWPLAASQSGRIYLRVGFRVCALVGTIFVVIGTALLTLLGESSSVFQVAGTAFFVGIGMGAVGPAIMVSAQSSVGWKDRGVVTGNNIFCRSLGSALAVAVFGAIANATLQSRADSSSGAALSAATHHVLIGIAVVALIMAIAVALMPRDPGAADGGELGAGDRAATGASELLPERG
jgi:EmrB/QacA subfamily drug resistance transporter